VYFGSPLAPIPYCTVFFFSCFNFLPKGFLEPDVAMQNAGVCIRYLSHKGVKTSTSLFILVMKDAQFFHSWDSVSLKNIKDRTDGLASWSQQATKKPPVPTPSLRQEWLGHNGAKHCCPSHTFWNLPPPTRKKIKNSFFCNLLQLVVYSYQVHYQNAFLKNKHSSHHKRLLFLSSDSPSSSHIYYVHNFLPKNWVVL
jgi:hypothetical protein